MEAASLASTRDDETVTARTLRLLSRVLDRREMQVSAVTRLLLHMPGQPVKGKKVVDTSTHGAMELRVGFLVLVANVLREVIFPKAHFVARNGTTSDVYLFVAT
jgi:hypothetical protein